ncbi:heat shock protein 70 [Nannochloropsis gaditana]|uniref:Heat shock protein 70 n=1 Tax=Nannochloropsis gaditana TaxID=72520 RepID=W7TVZ5_9STRA|nr:heat shock protein 70 [Nannochloropsis gaditana]
MAVVGIDLGNLNIVIAQAQRGGVDVILNENSNRQNPNLVSISDKQRFVGEQALTLARSNYKNTIYATKRFIGKQYDEPDVQKEIQSLPFKVVKLPSGGVGYEVTYGGEVTVLSPEQVVAMLFAKVNDIVKAGNNNVAIAEAVVAIPGWFTDAQRRAVLDAADIAGLNVLRLMHESTAVALSYGIYKSVRNLFHESDPQHVLFVDLGHSNFCASVVAFIQGKLIVKSAVYDRSLGGRDFDQQIVDFMAEQFVSKYKQDPREHPKALLKLQAAAEKAKKTLSPAGVSEASISVECVLEDTDLNTALSLEEFEKRVQPLLARLDGPIMQAMAEAGVLPEQLANVEVVGGGTRVNSVKLHIAALLKLDKNKLNYGLSTTLNADEAVSRGCALQAAILSSRFQVKPFEVLEACPYPIKLSWEEDASATPMDEDETGTGGEGDDGAVKAGDNSVLLFKRNDRVPNQRRITFRKDADFTVTAAYEDSGMSLLPPGTKTEIASFRVAIPKEYQGLGAKAKVRLSLVYNLHGVLVMTQAQLMEEVQTVPPASAGAETGKAEPGEEVKAAEAAGDGVGGGDTAAASAMEEEKKEDQPAKPETSAATATNEAAKQKKKYKTHSLGVVTKAPGLVKSEKDAFVEIEAQMEQQDRIIRETADTRNALESYIYDLKAKLGDSLKPYVQDEAATAFNAQLEEVEEWLYGDEGFDSTKSIYAAKLATLRALGDPIQVRMDEASKREPARVEFCRQLEEYKTLVKSTEEKYSHITDEERNKVREEVNGAESWLFDLLAKQNELPSHVDPVLTVGAIKERQNALAHAVLPVMNRPKPPPPAPAPAPSPSATSGVEDKTGPETKGDGVEATPKEGATEPTAMDEGGATAAENEQTSMDTAS